VFHAADHKYLLLAGTKIFITANTPGAPRK
jgi:hypothetical protein